MKWPEDTPAWLKTTVQNLEEMAERSLQNEPAERTIGFMIFLKSFRDEVSSAAESEESRRLKALHELTWKEQN